MIFSYLIAGQPDAGSTRHARFTCVMPIRAVRDLLSEHDVLDRLLCDSVIATATQEIVADERSHFQV